MSDEIYRAYFKCPRCKMRFTFVCNLTEYIATCPRCHERNIWNYTYKLVSSVDLSQIY